MAPTTWDEIGTHVMAKVDEIDELRRQVAALTTALELVKQRVSFWGGVASFLALLSGPLGALFWWILSHMTGTK